MDSDNASCTKNILALTFLQGLVHLIMQRQANLLLLDLQHFLNHVQQGIYLE